MRENKADRLLSSYLMWGSASIFVFIILIVFLLLAAVLEKSDIILYFAMLMTGFLWIGVTSVSRHIFVLLKRYIGKEISIIEFLSTQFIVVLFPFLYAKLRNEVRAYNKKAMNEGKG